MRSLISVIAAALAVVFVMAVSAQTEKGQVRTYYIAADPVVWNYTPQGMNRITGQPFGEEESPWTVRGQYTIGTEYKKALYRAYTDETFSKLKERPGEWEHLGFMGPLIRAEVGDTIRVVFKNNVHFPASVHPHGVFYEKDSEGAPYADGTSGKEKADDAVPPGGIHVYTWQVPERAGPAPGGLSSAFWMYHSHAQEVHDVNAGLIGPMIVTAKGMSGEGLRPRDVDREFVIAFLSIEEAASWYIQENVKTYMGDPGAVTYGRDQLFGGHMVITPDGESFVNRESMNGFSYGNMPMLKMHADERVRWYIMAGTNFEIHAPHWHGNTVTISGMRTDVMQLLTMGMEIADMVADATGIWFFHCHVSNHLMGGMSARYMVLLPKE